MQDFSITVAKITYRVSLQSDRTFSIMQNKNHLATIYPTQGHLKLIWKSKPELEKRLLKSFIESIESRQLANQTL